MVLTLLVSSRLLILVIVLLLLFSTPIITGLSTSILDRRQALLKALSSSSSIVTATTTETTTAAAPTTTTTPTTTLSLPEEDRLILPSFTTTPTTIAASPKDSSSKSITSIIPKVGYSFYKTDPSQAGRCLELALAAGVRYFDFATQYGSNEIIGHTLQSYLWNGLPTTDQTTDQTTTMTTPSQQQQQQQREQRRESLFLSHKISNAEQSTNRRAVQRAVKQELSQRLFSTGRQRQRAQQQHQHHSYLDMCSIHSPLTDRSRRLATYEALLELQQEGIVRHVGVCNYGIQPLSELCWNIIYCFDDDSSLILWWHSQNSTAVVVVRLRIHNNKQYPKTKKTRLSKQVCRLPPWFNWFSVPFVNTKRSWDGHTNMDQSLDAMLGPNSVPVSHEYHYHNIIYVVVVVCICYVCVRACSQQSSKEIMMGCVPCDWIGLGWVGLAVVMRAISMAHYFLHWSLIDVSHPLSLLHNNMGILYYYYSHTHLTHTHITNHKSHTHAYDSFVQHKVHKRVGLLWGILPKVRERPRYALFVVVVCGCYYYTILCCAVLGCAALSRYTVVYSMLCACWVLLCLAVCLLSYTACVLFHSIHPLIPSFIRSFVPSCIHIETLTHSSSSSSSSFFFGMYV